MPSPTKLTVEPDTVHTPLVAEENVTGLPDPPPVAAPRRSGHQPQPSSARQLEPGALNTSTAGSFGYTVTGTTLLKPITTIPAARSNSCGRPAPARPPRPWAAPGERTR